MQPFWCHYNWIEDTLRGYAQALRQASIEDVVAIQRDGIFLPDLSDDLYESDTVAVLELRTRLPPFPGSALPPHRPEQALIITSRHLDSRAPTMAWLARHGFGGYPVVFRDTARYPDGADRALNQARFKADMVVRHGMTAIYESDPLQAAYLSAMLPLTDVYCWNNDRNIRLRLGRGTLLDRL